MFIESYPEWYRYFTTILNITFSYAILELLITDFPKTNYENDGKNDLSFHLYPLRKKKLHKCCSNILQSSHVCT